MSIGYDIRDFDNLVKGNFCYVICTETRLEWVEE